LNLFAYTGIASLFAAKAGAKVTHVDASRPAITWANENRDLNGMQNSPIRWIVDDAIKFTEREAKRGVKYDAIIMDPPVYGHAPNGEPWDFNKDFPRLLENCKKIISDKPLFVLVNAYAISSSSITIANTLQGNFGDLGGTIENGELTLKEISGGRLLSTGIWAKWSK
jgi:23S rRNA (cytosine1962-C5)-methyltransferase